MTKPRRLRDKGGIGGGGDGVADNVPAVYLVEAAEVRGP